MQFSELVNIRQSVRRYSEQTVEEEKMDIILHSARLSPSACNSQPWHIIVVDEPDLKNKVAKATFNSILSFNRFSVSAPVILVIVMEKPKVITQIGGRIKHKEYPLYDVGIIAEHICLQAAEIGIGSCMMGWFDERKIMELLQIPSHLSVGLLITLGYAEEGYKQRKKIRKPVGKLVTYNSYV